jgi:hypothetical protein
MTVAKNITNTIGYIGLEGRKVPCGRCGNYCHHVLANHIIAADVAVMMLVSRTGK